MLSLKLKVINKQVLIINVPDNICQIEQLVNNCKEHPEIVIGFINKTSELQDVVTAFHKSQPRQKTILNIIYLKMRNNLEKLGINRDEMMQLGQQFNLEACRLLNVNENYSCMGFRSIEESAKINNSKPSQCVDDYIQQIPVLVELLPEPIKLQFMSLTVGYQKGWARYIFSAVQNKTRQTRLETTKKAISQGFKSIDQYQSSVKDKS